MSRHWIEGAARAFAIAALAVACVGCVTGGGSRLAEDVNANYPADATTRYARALGYMDEGRDERAIEEFEHVIADYPDYAGPHVNLAIIHGRNGRPDAALLALQRAVEVCSGCAVAYNQLGIEHRRQGRFADAEQAYLAAIEANPDYALAYFNLGVLYDLYQGRPDLALQYYEAYKARRRPGAADQKDVVDTWIIDLRRRVDGPQKTAEVSR